MVMITLHCMTAVLWGRRPAAGNAAAPASNLRVAVAILGVDVGKAGEAHTVAALLAVRAHPDEVFGLDRNPVVVQQVQALPFVQVRAVLLHVRFHEGWQPPGAKDRMCMFMSKRSSTGSRSRTNTFSMLS